MEPEDAAAIARLVETILVSGARAPGAKAPGAKAPGAKAARAPAAPAPGLFNWAPGEADRISLLPPRHEDLWQFYQDIEASHWTVGQIPLADDHRSWARMSDDQRRFVRHQLAFFARVDIDVLENLDANFGEEVDALEARAFYAAQKAQEVVHAVSYGLQIEAVLTGAERRDTLEAVRTMPIIAKMRDWVLRWMDAALPLGERLAAFTAVEGVLFSASFAGLQWLREQQWLPGITHANEYIMRDENLHTMFSATLIRRYLAARPTQARVEEIFGGVVALLDEFIAEAIPVDLIGMNAGLMGQYVRYQADRTLAAMGYQAAHFVANPFPFMDKVLLSSVGKANFFEHKPTQYQGTVDPGAARFAVDDEACIDYEDRVYT